jgi:uncharacterized protein YegP (UPF0339 family)
VRGPGLSECLSYRKSIDRAFSATQEGLDGRPFRPPGGTGRVLYDPERDREKGWMSESDPRFVIYRDVKDGYRWRLRSAEGETLERSERGHRRKDTCRQEVQSLRSDRYPGAKVRDATDGRFES